MGSVKLLLFMHNISRSDINPFENTYRQKFEDLIGIKAQHDDWKRTNPSKIDTLSDRLLELQPDDMTAWNYRKELIVKYPEHVDLDNELYLTLKALKINPKSYPSWYHRRWILNRVKIPDWSLELKLLSQLFSVDPRNFHAWQHRMWVLNRGNIPLEKEWEFLNTQIDENMSNYSAWHWKLDLILNGNWPSKTSWERLLEELQLIHSAYFTDPDENSIWVYHRTLMKVGQRIMDSDVRIETFCTSGILNGIRIWISDTDKIQQFDSKIQINMLIHPINVKFQVKLLVLKVGNRTLIVAIPIQKYQYNINFSVHSIEFDIGNNRTRLETSSNSSLESYRELVKMERDSLLSLLEIVPECIKAREQLEFLENLLN
jgi:hypothetical protein